MTRMRHGAMTLRQTGTASAPCHGVARAYQRCTQPICQPFCKEKPMRPQTRDFPWLYWHSHRHDVADRNVRMQCTKPVTLPQLDGAAAINALPKMATQGDMRATPKSHIMSSERQKTQICRQSCRSRRRSHAGEHRPCTVSIPEQLHVTCGA